MVIILKKACYFFTKGISSNNTSVSYKVKVYSGHYRKGD